MGVTLVEILTPVNLPQVFLWLQEKSLMGMFIPVTCSNLDPLRILYFWAYQIWISYNCQGSGFGS
jgi:hypothetical protein